MSTGPVRDHVTFTTARFNATEVLPHFINPCCFGEDCARWLVAGLRARGWEPADPWQEDWGWQTDGRRGRRIFRIDVALVPEDVPEWLVHLDEHAPFLARLRGAAGPPLLPDLARDVHALLAAAPDIGGVRWHFGDRFTAGKDGGAGDPLAPRSAAETG